MSDRYRSKSVFNIPNLITSTDNGEGDYVLAVRMVHAGHNTDLAVHFETEHEMKGAKAVLKVIGTVHEEISKNTTTAE